MIFGVDYLRGAPSEKSHKIVILAKDLICMAVFFLVLNFAYLNYAVQAAAIWSFISP